MRNLIILDYDVPIWRFFYGDVPIIPYSFEYENKIYKNGICIIQFAWEVSAFISRLKRDIHKYQNPILCAPDEQSYILLKNNFPNINVVLAVQNAFINENKYCISNKEKKYDIVVSSCFEEYKNLNVTKDIQNIVYVGYTQTNNEIFIPKNGHAPNFNGERNFNNYKKLSFDEIVDYYNQSMMGGIFSTVEGSCFSSGEYLLCGLPVISPKCKGGRQHWYNEKNCIYCDLNNDSIVKSINDAKEKLKSGYFNPEEIRNMHLKEMDIQRNNLTNAVIDIFKKISYNVPDFENLKNNLKYYHSIVKIDININNNYDSLQLKNMHIANDILSNPQLYKFNIHK